MRTPQFLTAATLALGLSETPGCHQTKVENLVQTSQQEDQISPVTADESDPTCPAYTDISTQAQIVERISENPNLLLTELARQIAVAALPILDGQPAPSDGDEICWDTYFDCVATGIIKTCQSTLPDGRIVWRTEVTPDPIAQLVYLGSIQIEIPTKEDPDQEVNIFGTIESTENWDQTVASSTIKNTPFGRTIMSSIDYGDLRVESGGFFPPEESEIIQRFADSVTETALLIDDRLTSNGSFYQREDGSIE